jgi:hypothetical protein
MKDLEICVKLSRKFIKSPYPTGDTVLLALFCLLTQKDPSEESSFHLICGYFGVLHSYFKKFRGRSLDKKLFKSGITEFLHQRLDDAFWGHREIPHDFTDPDKLKLDANVVPFLEEARNTFANAQCFFITENEYFGIGPRAMRPDDKIFVPFGCNVPLVICSTGREFVVIGSCLIYGLMNGEIMEKLERADVEPEELEFL